MAESSSNEGEVGKQLEEVSTKIQDRVTLPEIENDSVLDGELGKRLNQLLPIPVSEPNLYG